MNVARILYPVEVLGPGKRIGIWLAGCPHHCEECSNPELWKQRPEYELPVSSVVELLERNFRDKPVDGFVITGGDPMAQAGELADLLVQLEPWSEDILVYTGFTYEELLSQHDPAIMTCLAHVGVLIDGRYEQDLNDGARLRGSSNQRIFYFKEQLKPAYEAYMAAGPNQIQNFTTTDGVVSVGIHRANFQSEIAQSAKEKGVIVDGE